MAADYFMETISHSVSGVKTRTVGFQAKAYRITIGAKSGGSTFVTRSVGTYYDALGASVCDSSTAGSTSKADRYTDRVAFIREWNSTTSTWDTKTKAEHNGITATEIKYNVSTPDVNYQYMIEAWA